MSAMPNNVVEDETVEQIRFIIGRVFTEGQHWMRSIGLNDWRRVRYASSRRRRAASGPSMANIVDDIGPLLGYLEKEASNETSMVHSYIIIKPESGCMKEEGLALIRPVLKRNKDFLPQLNFHIWFHCMPSGHGGDHLMSGWRFEEPEGKKTIHNFYHAQPLRGFGSEGMAHGMHNRASEHFPTFPLPATNTVELCLNAVLVACGKETLRSLIRNSGNSKVRAAATIFWTKIFGNESADTEPEKNSN